MIRIESGDIIRKVQDHWTTKQILDYFQMDESTFKNNLQKSLNPKAYNGLMRELKRNDKLGGKSKKYTQKKCIEIPIANVNNAILVKDSKEEAKEIEKNFSTIQVIKNKISTLNSLISQLSKISSEYEESITDLKSSIEDNKKSIDKLEKETAEYPRLIRDYWNIIVIHSGNDIRFNAKNLKKYLISIKEQTLQQKEQEEAE